jgi:alcohol dehydrogenase class IV
MIAGLPGSLVAVTGADALTHATEAYLAKGHNAFSDALVAQAIRIIASDLREAVRGDVGAKHRMLMASCLAGLGFPNAGLGLVHAIANTVGGVYGVHHGTANAVLLPYVLSYNADAAPERYRSIGQFMGLDVDHLGAPAASELVVTAVRDLLRECGVPITLGEVGVGRDRIDELAAKSMEQIDRPGNPKDTSVSDIAAILEMAI